jgi:hypothetical protein
MAGLVQLGYGWLSLPIRAGKRASTICRSTPHHVDVEHGGAKRVARRYVHHTVMYEWRQSCPQCQRNQDVSMYLYRVAAADVTSGSGGRAAM